MNSYTPDNSSVLFLPDVEVFPEDDESTDASSEPVPEPTVLFMFGTAVTYLLMKERR